MNDLGLLLLGVAVRSTALVAVGLGLGWAFRRKGPAATSWLALSTLVGMVGIAALGASPWPRWNLIHRGDPPAEVAPPPTGAVRTAGVIGGATSGQAEEMVSGVKPAVDANVEAIDGGIVGALRVLGRALLSPNVEAGGRSWAWPAWIAVAAIVGVALGIGRFALGLAAVGALRSRSRPVEDPDLLELAAILRQRAGVRRGVEVRVAPGLAMPATIGWRRPLILIPDDWRGWDDAERRVVLAHELAHIRRGDYLAGIWAQLSLALQFYHPLAHWLAYRLRLGQELAADAWGAQLAGGSRTYLATLARLALRNEPRPVGWAARSFSPARGTFLRRIEMLRDSHDVSPSPLSRRSRALALGALALAALGLAGLRGPGSANEAHAQGPAPASPSGPTLDLGFIPADAGMVAAVRPAELMTSPEIRRLFESLDAVGQIANGLPVPVAEIEQVTFFWLPGTGGRGFEPSGVLLRATRPRDWKAAVIGMFGKKEVEQARFGEFTYRAQVQVVAGNCYATPDDRTFLLAPEPAMLRMLAARPGDIDRASWAASWKGIAKGQVSVAIDTSWLAVQLQAMTPRRPGGPGSPLDGFEPLVSQARTYALGVGLLGGLKVDGLASCDTDAAAKAVADTLRAGLTLGRNSIAAMKGHAPRDGRPETMAAQLATDIAGPLLDGAEVKVDGRTVHLTATSALDAPRMVAALAPAVQAQRAAAKRSQSVNNMKQIGLALLNYADQHGDRFPPAVLVGPDGKTPYSWRVAILPYVEQKALYDQYKFDESWDGPNNSKLLDKMPALFAHPDAQPGTSTSYFMPTGPRTISSDNKGTALREVLDGTFNTILVLEAKRDIPWSKPEDIPVPTLFDGPNKPLPKFGGFSPDGFNVLFADGSVRFIKDSIDPMVLKALFSKDGGEVISADAMNR